MVWMLHYIDEHVDLDYLVFMDDDCFMQLWRRVHFSEVVPRRASGMTPLVILQVYIASLCTCLR